MLDLFNTREFIIFSTRDYANHRGISLSAASKLLARLRDRKLLEKVTKGIWANISHPWFHPLSCVPHLLGKEQGYVSFLTALHLHGVLSQIPGTIQIATTGHERVLKSPVGTFEFFQLKPGLMQTGITWSDTQLPYLQATPEKALLDTLYIATRRNRRFASLPELDLESGNFSRKQYQKLLAQSPIPIRLRSAMRKTSEQHGVK